MVIGLYDNESYIYGNLYRKETWKEYLSKRPWAR